jgi:hypothetical protein
MATGRLKARFTGHAAPIEAVAFAPDGRSVASGSADTTALVWDVAGLSGKAGPAPRALTAAELQKRWDELAVAPAGTDAINALVASPQETVAFLRARLWPASPVDAVRVASLIDKLGSDDFEIRQQAHADLEAIGDHLMPYLSKVLSDAASLETRRRLEMLQQQWSSLRLTGERLRTVRAIEVLERIASPDARAVLQALAEGAPAALATREAKAALRRLQE